MGKDYDIRNQNQAAVCDNLHNCMVDDLVGYW